MSDDPRTPDFEEARRVFGTEVSRCPICGVMPIIPGFPPKHPHGPNQVHYLEPQRVAPYSAQGAPPPARATIPVKVFVVCGRCFKQHAGNPASMLDAVMVRVRETIEAALEARQFVIEQRGPVREWANFMSNDTDFHFLLERVAEYLAWEKRQK